MGDEAYPPVRAHVADVDRQRVVGEVDAHAERRVGVDAEIVGKRRISDAAAGFTQLVQLLAEAGDSAEDPIGSAPRAIR